MDFDISDFRVSELIKISRETFDCSLLQLIVNNKPYIVLFSPFRNTSIVVKVYTTRTGEKDFPKLKNILNRDGVKLTELKNTEGLILKLFFKDGTALLVREFIDLRKLDYPQTDFQRELGEFIREMFLKKMAIDENLLNKVVDIITEKEMKEIKQKQLDDYMKKVRENEKRNVISTDNLYNERKNASSYHIRW